MKASDILEKCKEILKERGQQYDVKKKGHSMQKTVSAFNAVTGHNLTAPQGWLFMTLLKAVRSQQGNVKLDNYVDGSNYFALMGEEALAADQLMTDPQLMTESELVTLVRKDILKQEALAAERETGQKEWRSPEFLRLSREAQEEAENSRKFKDSAVLEDDQKENVTTSSEPFHTLILEKNPISFVEDQE